MVQIQAYHGILIESVDESKQSSRRRKDNRKRSVNNIDICLGQSLEMYTVGVSCSLPVQVVELFLNKQTVMMKVNTRALYSTMNLKKFKRLGRNIGTVESIIRRVAEAMWYEGNERHMLFVVLLDEILTLLARKWKID